MSSSAQKLLHQAMKLPAPEHAALVEGLVENLDKPDPTLDALWLLSNNAIQTHGFKGRSA